MSAESRTVCASTDVGLLSAHSVLTSVTNRDISTSAAVHVGVKQSYSHLPG